MKEVPTQKSGGTLRRPVFVGLSLSPDGVLHIAILDQSVVHLERVKLEDLHRPQSVIFKWIHSYMRTNYVKVVALGVGNGGLVPTKEQSEELAARLWLREDVVPFIYKFPTMHSAEDKALLALRRVARHFNDDEEVDIQFDPARRVLVSELARLQDYQKMIPKDEFRELLSIARVVREKGERIRFFSSTPRGGGVALMRHALIRLLRLLEVDAHWYVMSPDDAAFVITKKKIHNMLQGVASATDELTDADKATYERWIGENVKRFSPVFKNATMIVIDDPQPSGMIPYIKEINPHARIVYRSHIQMETSAMRDQKTPQGRTWAYLWRNIGQADLFISHPIAHFVPHTVATGKTLMMGATTDEIDGLNKKLTPWQTDYYVGRFNKELERSGQLPIDTHRPYIVQVARFDPSKGIPDVLEAYRIFRMRLETQDWNQKDTPQLVIVGHGAVDDPEGPSIYKDTLEALRSDELARYAGDIKVARLPHNDQMLNAVLSRSIIALQLSYKEGFEVKVSEALAKGKPVIAYSTGGIPLQIENNVTGYLVEPYHPDRVAERLYELYTNKTHYAAMSRAAKARVLRTAFTAQSAIRWLGLASEPEWSHRTVETLFPKEASRGAS